jgi:NifU-like protein involved in Fe-S cluster formation
MFVRLENKMVMDCTFLTNGCAATLACGSLATELVKDKFYTVALQAISPENIIVGLGGLPEGNLHCAHLVSKIFRLALADGLALGKTPWKKAYKRF